MEELLNKYKQWLPSDPHLGMVRHCLLHGWAYIEMDEEKGIPFYINNHGGKIPLQDVRWEPSIGGSESMSANEVEGNKFGTICDTVDAMISKEGKIESSEATKFIKDIIDMSLRMKKRETEVSNYLSEMKELLVNSTEDIQPFNDDKFNKDLKTIRNLLSDERRSMNSIQEIGKGIKKEAENLEEILRAQMQTAIAIGTLFDKIKGNRNWNAELMKKQGII